MLGIDKTLEFTKKLAVKTGNFLVQNQERVEIKTYKDRQDIQTNIDIQAENILIHEIEEKFPKHSILSEEKGLIDKKSAYTWVIDPLDGTKEYFRGLPVYNVNISLEKNKNVIVGVVYIPKLKTLYSAVKNKGAYKNNKKISVSTQNKLKNSFIFTHLPRHMMSLKMANRIWDRLEKVSRSSYRLRSFQTDILSLCWLACGGHEAFFLFEKINWWDIAAGFLIAQESGAKITNLKGEAIENHNLSKGIVASNGKIHNQLLELLS